MDKRPKNRRVKTCFVGDCTGGTVHVVSFPPFYNMIKPSRAYEIKESSRLMKFIHGNAKITSHLTSQQTDQRSSSTISSTLKFHIASTHRGLEVSLAKRSWQCYLRRLVRSATCWLCLCSRAGSQRAIRTRYTPWQCSCFVHYHQEREEVPRAPEESLWD
jgi:hypothetical protein